MKILKFVFLCTVLLLSSCMEDFNERYFITEHFIEFEEATRKNKVIDKDYVLSSEKLTNESSKILLQVNLVGPALETPISIRYKLDNEHSTAIQGRDFDINAFGELTFDAHKNIAFIQVEATDQGEGNHLVVLELIGNDFVKPSENYKKVAFECRYP